MSLLANSRSFDELREAARKRLPNGLFEYIDRGVGSEAALRGLRSELDAIKIAPKVLRSDRNRVVECSLFGHLYKAPLIIAPTAMAGLIYDDGEVVLGRVASRLGIPICLSTQSITSIEYLREKVPNVQIWMQLYLWQERELSLKLLRRAKAANADVLVMTVDTPYGARKEWNIRSGFDVPFRLSVRSITDLCTHPRWLINVMLVGLTKRGIPALNNYPSDMRPKLFGNTTDDRVSLRQDLGWEDVEWVRKHWKGKLVLKGIMTVDDARKAALAGADGIVVSSHGARNFDAAPSPISVLPNIIDEVGKQMTVMADSGIRRGLDVLRYKLCGAEAVMVGRLPLWALAAGGEVGLENALSVLKQEYIEALDFSGQEGQGNSKFLGT